MDYGIVISYDPKGAIKDQRIFTSRDEALMAQKTIAGRHTSDDIISAYTVFTDGLAMTMEEVLEEFVKHINDGDFNFQWRCDRTTHGTDRKGTERLYQINSLASSLDSAEKATGDLEGALNDALKKIGSALRVR